MAAVALIGSGVGFSSWLRARALTHVDSATARSVDADAEKKEAETDIVRVNAYAALWEKVNVMEAEYARKLAAESVRYQAGIDSVREQLLADIEAKDIRISHLETHVARLNAESLEREKKYNALQSFTEGVIQAFAILDAQLRAANMIPAAKLPAKPDTGPLKV